MPKKKVNDKSVMRPHKLDDSVRSVEKGEGDSRNWFERCPSGLASCRLDGTLVEVNPAFAAIVGRTVEETLNLTYWQITPEKYLEQEKIQLESLKKTGKYGPYEKEYIHKDGHLVPVRLKGAIVEIEGEQFIWSSIEDLSEQKQAEQKISESYSLLQAVMEGTSDAIFAKDLQGRLLLANSAVARIFGRPKEEVIGRGDAELLPAEVARKIIEIDRRILTTGVDETFEEVLAVEGIPRTYLTKKSAWRDKDGNIIGLIGIARDITERKQAEETLRSNEERLNLALEATDNGMWDWNIVTGEAYFSPQLLRMGGYSPGDLEGNVDAWVNLIHPDDVPKVMELLTPHLEGRSASYEAEFRMRTKSGEWQWILDSGKVVERDEDGKPLRMLGTHKDISHAKLAEREQQKFTALIESSSDFVGIATLAGEPLYVNEAGRKLVGLDSLEEVKQTNVIEYFFPEDRDRVEEQILPSIVQQGHWEGEVRFRNFKTGEAIPVIWNAFTLKEPQTGEAYALATVTRDISDRKQAEEALKASERRSRALFNQAFQFMGVLTPDGILIDANQTALEFVGCKIEEVVGQPFWETPWCAKARPSQTFARQKPERDKQKSATATQLSPTQQRIKEAVAKAAKGKFYREELEIVGAGNRVAIVDFSLKPVTDETGKVVLLIPEGRDISDRKILERELALRQARFDAFFTTAPAGLAILDDRLRFVQINPNLAQMNGLPVEAHLGKTLREVLPETAPVLEPLYQRVLNTGEALLNIEISGEMPQQPGFKWYCMASYFPLFGSDGTPNGVGTVISDITDRKRAEEQLRQYQEHLEELVAERTAELSAAMARLQQEVQERERAVLALTESEERFRATVDRAAVGIVDADLAGRFLRVNPKFCEIVGYEPEELLRLKLWEIIHPDDLAASKAAARSLARGDVQTYSMEKRYIRKDGSFVWVNLTKSLVREPSGKPHYTIGVIHDISDRVALEKELAKKQALFDAFFRASFAGMTIFDSDLRFVQVNEALAEINGKSVAEHLGKTLAEVLPDLAPYLEPQYRRVLTAGEPIVNQEISGYTAKQPDFLRHWMVSIFALPGDGGFIGVGAVVIEITERKQAEADLQRSYNLLRSVMESTPDLVFVKDLEGRYVMLNTPAAILFGKEIAEIVGKADAELWLPEIARQLRDNDLRVMTAGVAEAVEEFVQNGEFTGTYLSTKSPWRDAEGNVIGLIGMSRDITERKRMEEALQKNEELYRTLAKNFPNGAVMLYDRDLRYTLAEGTELAAVGLSKDLLEGKTMWELFPPEVCEAIAPLYRAAFSGQSAVGEVTFADRIYLVQTLPLANEQGEIVSGMVMSQNITDRKRMEEALKEREAQYRRIVETAGEGIWTIDADSNTAFVNQKMADMLGYTIEEMLGQPMFAFMDSEGVAIANAQLERRRQGISENHDFKFRRKDGSDLWVMISTSALFDERGEYAGALGMLTDVTARREAEEARRLSEQALREQAQREKLLNHLTTQIRNSLDLQAILQTTVQEIRNLMQVDWCLFGWYRLNASEPMWEGVYEARDPGLKSLLGSYPIDLESPWVQQLLAMQIARTDDVSTLDDAAMRQVYISTNIASALSLPIPSQSGDIGMIVCNHARLRPWRDVEVELLQALGDRVAIAIDQARLYEQTRTKARELEQTLHELRSTQTQLIQSEKMSSLGQLVAGVAHEINNPVNFIYGNLTHANDYAQDLLRLLQLYQENYPNPAREIVEEMEAIELDFLQEDLPKLLDSMKVGADRIREIVLSLRNFSRLDEAQMKDVDIHEGIKSTLLILQNRLKAKPDYPPIEVVEEFGNLPLVECYPGQLNQVFMNVLANAIDALENQPAPRAIAIRTFLSEEPTAMPPHSPQKVELKNSNPLFSPTTQHSTLNTPHSQFAAIVISDNGPGMTDEVRARLFDPFFTTKPIGKGTGLGLSIAYQIVVEKHGGRLHCVSAPGKGTAFVIEIPLRQRSDKNA